MTIYILLQDLKMIMFVCFLCVFFYEQKICDFKVIKKCFRKNFTYKFHYRTNEIALFMFVMILSFNIS